MYSIDSIIESGECVKVFIFLFNYYDCQPCVEAGLVYAKRLDSLAGKQIVFGVASMVDPTPYQAAANYLNYIYFDSDDKIRKELKFAPTPQLLLLNKNREIVLSFMPRDTVNSARFLQELEEKYDRLP